jgi:hypothetical protein
MMSQDEMRPEPGYALQLLDRLMLDQEGLTGWAVIAGKVTTPLAGPVRVKVLSWHLKAVDLTQGGRCGGFQA